MANKNINKEIIKLLRVNAGTRNYNQYNGVYAGIIVGYKKDDPEMFIIKLDNKTLGWKAGNAKNNVLFKGIKHDKDSSYWYVHINRFINYINGLKDVAERDTSFISNKKKYILCSFPEVQDFMEHDRWSECIFCMSIEGHPVEDSTYAVPEDLYNKVKQIKD